MKLGETEFMQRRSGLCYPWALELRVQGLNVGLYLFGLAGSSSLPHPCEGFRKEGILT